MTRTQTQDEIVLAKMIAAIETIDLDLKQHGAVMESSANQMCAIGALILGDSQHKFARKVGLSAIGSRDALMTLVLRGYPPSYVAGINDGFENDAGALGAHARLKITRDSSTYRRGWSIGRAVAVYAGLA